MKKIKVLIADDHYLFVRGIESILSEDDSLQVIGKASNGEEAFEMAKQHLPDVVLLDVNMPVMDGLQALKLIIAELPDAKVLMLTMNDSDDYLIEALKSGAKGFLHKNLMPNELLTFIHMVNRGESVISGRMAGKIIENLTRSANLSTEIPDNKADKLTRREKEILTHVMKGLTNREIAGTLFISENTVKNHLRNIMEKLQMSNRIQAATYALQEGWLQEV
ncbi:response regulator transcription factor [Neobacillus drentensis]|uniref:response regulator transcription factor n=1 Tax=Neobacillus drentensis TaxID=220684 RepID=UPI003000791B